MGLDPVTIELSADATWPAETTVLLGPWKLRATHGCTHRANSVRTAHAPIESNWPDLIAKVEDFYRTQNLPPTFHLSPATAPANLDDLLAKRGYIIEAPSQVWSATPTKILAATRSTSPTHITVSETPDNSWLHCAQADPTASLKIREQIYRRIPAPRVFATTMVQNQPIARAASAIHSNIAWLYSMATIPTHRRHGFARQLIHALAQWAINHSTDAMYLQVLADNPAAHSLYAHATFKHEYNYHYRVKTN
jgi:N-acetylglutamate synthase